MTEELVMVGKEEAIRMIEDEWKILNIPVMRLDLAVGANEEKNSILQDFAEKKASVYYDSWENRGSIEATCETLVDTKSGNTIRMYLTCYVGTHYDRISGRTDICEKPEYFLHLFCYEDSKGPYTFEEFDTPIDRLNLPEILFGEKETDEIPLELVDSIIDGLDEMGEILKGFILPFNDKITELSER